MNKFIRKTTVTLQVLIMASVFIFAVSTFDRQVEYSDSLNTQIVMLNQEKEDNLNHYTETIIKIVENVKITDSYLFSGGFSDEPSSSFSLKSYEDMLTLNNDFSSMLQDLNNFFDDRSDYYSELPNVWPLFSTSKIAISSPFGDRFNPFTGKISLTPHSGIDLVTTFGDAVIATADGYIRDNWIMHWKFGRWVVIQHKNNIETHYAHMSKVIVHEGDWVKKGQVIGYLGNSGMSTGPHLHYGVCKDGVFVDPINFLRQSAVFNKED